jgi:hypothetical protein
MKENLTRFRVGASVVVVAQSLALGTARAAPSDRQAWSSQKYGITVYADELDPDLFWFVPLIRFESANGKTVLRPSTRADGKVEYITRIIPYFPEDYRDLVTQNLPNIRQESQLKPIVAKNIGVALPDFGYKTTSETVTSIQYLDVPRIVRFSLDPDEAKLFDSFYAEDPGIPVEYTISYDGVLKDKFYQIGVSCRDMNQELDVGTKPGTGIDADVGKNVHVGADLEVAFKRALQNTQDGIDIVQKGDAPELADALRETLQLCFEPTGNSDEDELGRRYLDGEDDPADVDPADRNSGDLMPKAVAKVRFQFKKSAETSDRKANVKQVTLKDTTNTTVIVGTLSSAATAIEKISAEPIASRTISVTSANTAVAPLDTGIRISAGQQWTINAEVALKKNGRPMAIPAGAKLDGTLYYRIGDDEWQPVNRHLVLASDFARGSGDLEFYVDTPAITAQLPAGPWGPSKGVSAEYSVTIGGRTLVDR